LDTSSYFRLRVMDRILCLNSIYDIGVEYVTNVFSGNTRYDVMHFNYVRNIYRLLDIISLQHL